MPKPLPLLPLMLLAACGSGADDTGEALPYDFDAFDAELEAYLGERGLEGAGAVVVDREHGVVHVGAYGSHEPGRISLIASSSKVMSVGVLVALADQGLLDLDAPISEPLAAWGSFKTDITVAQLLSNSSGMVGLVDDPTYLPYLCQYTDSSDLAGCAEAIYSADDAEDRVPPDSQYRYGGGAWQLAGGIAQEASDQTWAELVDQIYAQPCGLESTGYRNHFTQAFTDGGVDGALAYPGFFDGDLDDLNSTTNPNIEGGAYTTAADYGRVLELQLRDGRCGEVQVLSAAGVGRMRQDRIGPAYDGSTGITGFDGYGLGWFVDRESGTIADPGAFGAMPWIDQDRGYGAMVILESTYNDGFPAWERLAPLLEEQFPLE